MDIRLRLDGKDGEDKLHADMIINDDLCRKLLNVIFANSPDAKATVTWNDGTKETHPEPTPKIEEV